MYYRQISLAAFLVCFYSLSAQNVLISSQGSPNEPSIIMDPKNPGRMVAGANLNNCYTSSDTGRTWQEKTMYSSFGVWGDPSIAVDTAGSFYYFHLSNMVGASWIDRIVCQKSADSGKTWSDGSYTGLNGTKAQDKQWFAIDKKTNHMYITWTQFDTYGTPNPADSSIILFSKSTDGGLSWSQPKRISKFAGDCIDEDNTVEGAVPAIGPKGEIYVAWAGPKGLMFNYSLDGGNTWLAEEITVDSMPSGWDYDIPGIYRCNGLPVTACDLSNGPNRGTIYINWSDQRKGPGNTEVWVVKSRDGGKTWSKPILVNNDNSGRQQFLTWMTIDQANGDVYFVFYDRRHYVDDSTDVYLARTSDGGQTFINKRISESPFLPNAGVFFGDYNNITAHNGIVRPIWTRLHNGQLSVWTDISDFNDHSTSLDPLLHARKLEFENYPNPAHSYTFVSFKLHATSTVNLRIVNMEGKNVAGVISGEIRAYGKYVERIDLTELGLANGTYTILLEIDGVLVKSNPVVIQ
jgi:hypothetical protein